MILCCHSICQNTQENIESDWANLMNLIGVENNLDGDVEGEMFSNLFAFNDDRDGDGDDDAVQVKMEGGEEESQLRGLENIDFPMFDDPLLGYLCCLLCEVLFEHL